MDNLSEAEIKYDKIDFGGFIILWQPTHDCKQAGKINVAANWKFCPHCGIGFPELGTRFEQELSKEKLHD